MTAWYNEIDPNAAAWLRGLIRRGLIADGVVDERDVRDVSPLDIKEFEQCHFFAGIGVWSYVLRRADWPDDEKVWTGSCPCQPFSAAGTGGGFDDERHLWPAWFWLIEQCQPAIVFGEQVASKAATSWIDLVSADLEALGYRIGAIPFPAASVDAPHIRDRIYWVADTQYTERWIEQQVDSNSSWRYGSGWGGDPLRLGDSQQSGLEGHSGNVGDRNQSGWFDTSEERPTPSSGATRDMANASSSGQHQYRREWREFEGHPQNSDVDRSTIPGPTNGLWKDVDWLRCRDGLWRPVEPGTFPLVDGSPQSLVRGGHISEPIEAQRSNEARKMRLRGYGNALNVEAALNFVMAYQEVTETSIFR